ncbi:MAG TPA: NeuD/PglB/VioB family sugar acetyltransferase [Rhizomicrobium sp.]|nr:NeuD/PglB/VioB family sugar acetyltransferase [Rhizomicrobium sp.]
MKRVVIAPIEWDVVDLAESCGYQIVGFLDKHGRKPCEPFRYIGRDEDWADFHRNEPDVGVIVVVEPAKVRERLLREFGASAMTVISPASHVSKHAEIGAATVIQRNVTVMPRAKLGRGCTVNVGAIIHHEAEIAEYCTIGPGALLAGSVILEPYAYVGAGAVILQNIRIGTGAKIGAGAVVTADVPPGQVVVGIPARAKAHE